MSGIMLAFAGGQYAKFAPTVIGQAFGGGYYAGSISTAGTGVADYYLVIGPVASAQNSAKQFATTSGSDPTSVIDGPTNSATMDNITHPAAQFCEAVTAGGFTDWYMPAKNELEVCYYNLKPTTTSNNTSSGINANAVPARASNYTAGTPAQTSAADFITGTGGEAFTADGYWASTQAASSTAFRQIFSSGYQGSYGKNVNYFVRVVRRVAV
jgi:hypothetical protein